MNKAWITDCSSITIHDDDQLCSWVSFEPTMTGPSRAMGTTPEAPSSDTPWIRPRTT